MNKKNLFILIILALVCVVFLITTQTNRRPSRASSITIEDKIFSDFPLNDVSKIRITASDTPPLLLQRQAEGWSIPARDDYQANFSTISSLLKTIWQLKPAQVVNVNPVSFPRLELERPDKPDVEPNTTGTLVEFFTPASTEKPVATLLLGKTQDSDSPAAPFSMGSMPTSRFILNMKDPATVLLVRETFDAISPHPQDWLAPGFIQIHSIQSVEVTSPENPPYTLQRETADDPFLLTNLPDSQETDATAASALRTLLANSTLVDVIPQSQQTELAQSTPLYTIKIQTFNAWIYIIHALQINEADEVVTIKVEITTPFTAGTDKADAAASSDANATPDSDTSSDSKFDALQEKALHEQKWNNGYYKINHSALAPVLKPKSHFIQSDS